MKTIILTSVLLFSSSLMASTIYNVQFAMRSIQHLDKAGGPDYKYVSSEIDPAFNPKPFILIYTKNPIVKLKKMELTSDPAHISMAILSKSTIALSDIENSISEVVDAQVETNILKKVKSISTNSNTKFKPVAAYEKMISDFFTEFNGNANFKMKLLDVPNSAFPCDAEGDGLKCTRTVVYNYEITVE